MRNSKTQLLKNIIIINIQNSSIDVKKNISKSQDMKEIWNLRIDFSRFFVSFEICPKNFVFFEIFSDFREFLRFSKMLVIFKIFEIFRDYYEFSWVFFSSIFVAISEIFEVFGDFQDFWKLWRFSVDEHFLLMADVFMTREDDLRDFQDI